MTREITLFLLFFLYYTFLYGQTSSLSGTVMDEKGSPLSAALIHINDFDMYTDQQGLFVMQDIPSGTHHIEISFPRYETYHQDIVLPQSQLLTIVLNPVIEQLHEVILDDISLRYKENNNKSIDTHTINREFLSTYRGGSLMQSLKRIPGVSSINIGSSQSKPTIRGLGFNRVSVLENGIKHQAQQWGVDHGLEISQYIINRLTLIKGPASLTYGSDAIGGVIKTTSIDLPKPNVIGGKYIAEYNHNNLGLINFIKIYARKYHWHFSTSASYRRYADYKIPTNKVAVYSYEVPLHNNTLRNTAGEQQNYNFQLGYLNSHFKSDIYVNYNGVHSGFFADAHGREPRNVDRPFYDADRYDIQYPRQSAQHLKLTHHTKWFLNQHTLKFDWGVQQNLRKEFNKYIAHGYMPNKLPASLGIANESERVFELRTWSANLKDKITIDKHQINFGISHETQFNNIGGWGFIIPSYTQNVSGAFIYDQFNVSEKSVLHFGLRYDTGNIHIKSYRDWFVSISDQQSITIERAEDFSKSFGNISWGVGFNIHYPHLSLSTNIGKSFRMPIAKELASNGINYHQFSYERGHKNLTQEESYQWDLGIKIKYLKGNIAITPFASYSPNYIYLNPTAQYDLLYGAGNQIYQYQQSEVFRYGGEIEAQYHLIPNLELNLGIEYVDAFQLSGAKKGFGLPFLPPLSILTSIRYHPKRSWGRFSKYYLELSHRATSAQNKIVPPEKPTQGYQEMSIQTGFAIRALKKELAIKIQLQNIFNTVYFDHTSFYRLINVPNPGRNINLSLTIPFTF